MYIMWGLVSKLFAIIALKTVLDLSCNFFLRIQTCDLEQSEQVVILTSILQEEEETP